MDDSDSSDEPRRKSPQKRPSSPSHTSPGKSPKRTLFKQHPPTQKRGKSFDNEDQHNSSSSAWTIICTKVSPLFHGEGLRTPIEDLNRLVESYLSRTRQAREERHVLRDLTQLFESGLHSLAMTSLSDEKLITRVSEVWGFYHASVVPYLEAAFLPITRAWSEDSTLYLPSTGNPQSVSLSVYTIALKCYRDVLILPLHARIRRILGSMPLLLKSDDAEGVQGELFSRILQCVSLLRRVQSNDQGQRDMESLSDALFLRRAKGRGDRRGIIGAKAIEL